MACYFVAGAKFAKPIQVFSSLTRTISTAKNIIGKNPRESFLDRLPKSTKDEVLHVSPTFSNALCSKKLYMYLLVNIE